MKKPESLWKGLNDDGAGGLIVAKPEVGGLISTNSELTC